MQNFSRSSERGYVIVLTMVFMAVIIVASTALIGYTTLNIKSSRQDYWRSQALYLAEAGLERAIYEFNQNSSYNGEVGTEFGEGVFTVTVATINNATKSVAVTGYIPDNVNPKVERTVRANVAIDSSVISFNSGVQVGEGGLVMNNGSLVNGNVFSNGNVTGGSGTIDGDLIIAAGAPATPDQEWTVQNSNFNFGNVSSRRDAAQSFIPTVAGNLNKVALYLKKVGSPGDLTIRVVTNSGSNPSKTTVGGSGTISASMVTGSYGWIEGTLGSTPNLNAGTKYWIIVTAPVNAGNYYVWGLDNTDGYTGNTGKYSSNWNASSPVWHNAGGDFNFKTFVGGTTTALDGSITVTGNARADAISGCSSVLGDAYYMSINSCPVSGVSYPGTPPVTPEPMPISDAQIDEWKAIASGGTGINNSVVISGTQTYGPAKIDGSLVISNGATLYLTGPVWVTGDITISNNAFVLVHNSLDNNSAVLMASHPTNPSGGNITVSNNAVIEGNGNANSFVLILSTSNGSGALNISNNAAGAIFYASDGTVQLSNNAGGNQITGWRVEMSNNSTVTYVTGLQNAIFSNGPGGSWRFVPGTYVIE